MAYKQKASPVSAPVPPYELSRSVRETNSGLIFSGAVGIFLTCLVQLSWIMTWISSVLFSLWQVIPCLLYNTTPSIFIPPQSEKFLCSSLLAPPSPPVCVACERLVKYRVCGWRNGVSVCPRGSSHTQLEGKGHTAWIPPSPPLFRRPFHSLYYYSAWPLRESIVCLCSHTHRRTKRDGEDKDDENREGASVQSLPSYASCAVLIRYTGSTWSWPCSCFSTSHPLLVTSASLFCAAEVIWTEWNASAPGLLREEAQIHFTW